MTTTDAILIIFLLLYTWFLMFKRTSVTNYEIEQIIKALNSISAQLKNLDDRK